MLTTNLILKNTKQSTVCRVNEACGWSRTQLGRVEGGLQGP